MMLSGILKEVNLSPSKLIVLVIKAGIHDQSTNLFQNNSNKPQKEPLNKMNRVKTDGDAA